MVSIERLMCCEVEFFWEVCVEEGASGLFSLMWFREFSTHCYQIGVLESFKLSKSHGFIVNQVYPAALPASMLPHAQRQVLCRCLRNLADAARW